jgi:hypothetical protein
MLSERAYQAFLSPLWNLVTISVVDRMTPQQDVDLAASDGTPLPAEQAG